MGTQKVPKTIGIIMDGNRRWAKQERHTSLEGHSRGAEKVKEVARWARQFGIKNVIFYAFSTENWKRSAEEVSYLMELFRKYIGAWSKEIHEEGGVVQFVGDRSRFSKELQKEMDAAHELTKANTGGRAVFALSYGGRADIIQAFQRLIGSGKKTFSEEEVEKALWTVGIPDPDLIIRTGGEQRLSNFLTWQSVYSELVFTKTYWPAFSKEEFESILSEFATRERRMGK